MVAYERCIPNGLVADVFCHHDVQYPHARWSQIVKSTYGP